MDTVQNAIADNIGMIETAREWLKFHVTIFRKHKKLQLEMNITYLLGAGASYNALPIVNEMLGRLESFRSYLASNRHELPKHLHEANTSLMSDIKWLIEEADKHQTIDTLARKLFSQTKFHVDLKKLKQILTVYFLYEQSPLDLKLREGVKKQIPDKRYDSFLASLISLKIDDPRINSSVKVLTWNYDLQFEHAYKQFIEDVSIKQVQQRIQSIPGEWILKEEKLDLNKFAVVRLNGIAGIDNYDTNEKKDTFLDSCSQNRLTGKAFFNALVDHYNEMTVDRGDTIHPSDSHKYLNFAWEALIDFNDKSPFSKLALNAAYAVAEQTDVLVIIGYSFPIFNREIDKAIIDRMNNLKKVYVQDPSPKPIISLTKGAFARFNTISIQEETNISYFLLAYEL